MYRKFHTITNDVNIIFLELVLFPNSAQKYKHIINSKTHRKIQTVPKLQKTFTQTLTIILNLKKNNSTAKVTPELLKKIQTDAENSQKSALKLGDILILFSGSALPCLFCCTYTKFISTVFLVTNKL